jgi:rhomboid-like protein
MHIGFNMFALHSFGVSLCYEMGPTDFLTMYLSSSVFASLCSRLWRVARRDFRPSLGASGALMSMIAYTAMSRPDAQVGIIFLPGSFPISYGLYGLVTFDLVCLLLRKSFLDHAGHLGGVAFGLLFWKYKLDFEKQLRKLMKQK